jgi:hypothetical protein
MLGAPNASQGGPEQKLIVEMAGGLLNARVQQIPAERRTALRRQQFHKQ